MKLLTQNKHLDKILSEFPEEKNLIEKVRAGSAEKYEADINGMPFLFFGPCDQCGEYKEAYVSIGVQMNIAAPLTG